MTDLPTPSWRAEEVRAAVDAVLSRAEFADAQPTWWQQLLRLLGDGVGRLLELIGGGGRGSVIGTVALLAVLAVGVLVVVRYTRTLQSDRRIDLAMDAGLGRSSEQWLSDARDHEEAGRWRDAVRCRYRALLAALSAAGLVEEIAGRTSGEYLAAVQADVPRAGDAFADATRQFELAWYGHGATTRTDAEAFAEASRRTLSDAGVRRAAAVASA